ncbi:MAG: phosphoenolpyruvate--protein phosphotransferase [Candidatus Aadella gelida]|nr:phosphoenolpyruvate--protein phosphotransferase [Candidatus Aadella gelida]
MAKKEKNVKNLKHEAQLSKEDGMDSKIGKILSNDVEIEVYDREYFRNISKNLKDEACVEIIYTLTHKVINNARKAKDMYYSIMDHQDSLSRLLGRNVGIEVATLDFLKNMENELNEPRIIEKNKLDKISEKAITDGGTGIYDKETCNVNLEVEIERSKRYRHDMVVFFCDIDDFKKINDIYGHVFGDKVITEIVNIMQTGLRTTDSVYRYGGEEFVSILPETDQMKAFDVADRILKDIRKLRMKVEGKKDIVNVTVSIGVAGYNGLENITATQLINRADKLMYKAKKLGKNRVEVYGGSPGESGRTRKVETKKQKREILQGMTISPGRGKGKVLIYKDILSRNLYSDTIKKEEVDEELKRIKEVKEKIIKDLDKTQDVVKKDMNKAHADIFQAHKMILQDKIIMKDLESIIRREMINAEQAVKRVFSEWVNKFKYSDNKSLQSKAFDILDVEKRLIRALLGYEHNMLDNLPKNTIVVAKRLLPSDTVRIDEKNISGLVLEEGNGHSHSAIIAKAMGLPAITRIKDIFSKINDGDELLLLGAENKVIKNPDKKDKQKYLSVTIKEKKYKVSKKPVIMKNGDTVKVYANVATETEVEKSVKNGCDGIGLFRIERIYMGLDKLPDESFLVKELDLILDHAKDKEITVRLLDIGSDKNLPYIDIDDYMDPSLGVRGVRTLLKFENLLEVQLRTLILLSKKYMLRILVPMVTVPEEIGEIKKFLRKNLNEINKKEEGGFNNIPVGAMIETPAAVMGIKELAKKSDFLSIGTNDLIQYTMAAGRENNELSDYFDKGPSVLMDSLAEVVKTSKGLGIECGICGEIAGEEQWIKPLVDIGIREFSVSPGSINFLKSVLRKL